MAVTCAKTSLDIGRNKCSHSTQKAMNRTKDFPNSDDNLSKSESVCVYMRTERLGCVADEELAS